MSGCLLLNKDVQEGPISKNNKCLGAYVIEGRVKYAFYPPLLSDQICKIVRPMFRKKNCAKNWAKYWSKNCAKNCEKIGENIEQKITM